MAFLRFETSYIIYFLIISILFFWIGINIFLSNFKPKIKINWYNYTLSKKYFILKTILFLLSWILFGIAFFGPIKDQSDNKKDSKDIIFLLDVSKSMDAMDCDVFGNKISRIDCAKELINYYINKNSYNNYWLVIFGWEAINISPLTNDIDMFTTFLNNVNSNQISKWWTNLEEAVKVAIFSWKNKNLVLLSDWEDLTDNNLSSLKSISKIQNIKIFGVWVWSLKWANIPTGNDFFGNVTYKNFDWQKVVTKLDEKSLKNITSLWNWGYIKAKRNSNISEFDNLFITSNQKLTDLRKKQSEWSYIFIVIWVILLLFWDIVQYKKLIW